VPAAPRHAKRKALATRLRAPALAAVTLAGVAAAFAFGHGGSAAPVAAGDAIAVPGAGSALTVYQMATAVHRDVAVLESRQAARARRAALRRHLAALAAARRARQQAAHSPPPTPTPAPTPAPSSGGGDAAHSSLGICIRNAEEGGSYVWGPGNGGGAYQFLLSTWENYGGAASEYGVAGPAYQDQIFDNAIAAGGASNWTNYDGC
jgi:Transglycosylase-like domain